MGKTRFKLVDMHCLSCKLIVEEQLKNKNGIKRNDGD